MNEQFLKLAKQLREACEAQDFEAIGLLDLKVKEELQCIIEGVKTDQDKAFAVSILKRYEKIYNLIIQDSIKNRDEISTELRKVIRESKAANMYLNSAAYK